MLDHARSPVHRDRLRRARRRPRPRGRQAGLLRRRLARRLPAPLRRRDGARRGGDDGFAARQRGGGADDAHAAPGHHARRARPRRRPRPHALRSSASPTRCRRRSRRACSSPRRCSSTSACRWVLSSPRSTRNATNTGKSWPRRARRSGPDRPAVRGGADGALEQEDLWTNGAAPRYPTAPKSVPPVGNGYPWPRFNNPAARSPAPRFAPPVPCLIRPDNDLITTVLTTVPTLSCCLFRARSSPQPTGCKLYNTLILLDFAKQSAD